MSLLDHFKPWKLVAEMDIVTNWTGGLFFPDRSWSERNTIAFYEKVPRIRKIKIIGDNGFQWKDHIEKIVYKWRDHKGELPYGAIEIDYED